MKVTVALVILALLTSSAKANQEPFMRYMKITVTFLNFDTGERSNIGTTYASYDLRIKDHEIVAKTFEKGKALETRFHLQTPEYLNFVAKTNDPSIPEMRGRFLNSDYEECIMNADFIEQKLSVNGILTKIDQSHALSVKTMTNSLTGKVVGIVQEQVELISEEAFLTATVQK